MAQFTDQDFFGGAIRGVVPQRWIDASNLREIPDHQELFLSSDTLSSLIIEINQRVSQEDALSTFRTLSQQDPTLAAGSGSPATASPEAIDQAAALYHLHDLCEEGDGFQVVSPPHRVSPSKLVATAPAGSPVAVFKGIAQIRSVPRQRGGQPPSGPGAVVAGEAVDGGQVQATTLTCHYLLVRLQAQETDLLIFFNSLIRKGDAQGLAKEESLAEDTIQALVEEFEIRDWGLFV
ncbi:hypothetical protein N7468_005031 [Penicillium chermesinum]|uniref:Ran guanine nucleotide release factor n=1 Tax=Penicillium chermesinum TaxID=63820 RepID=A0A9W9TMM3_9EURO|nr:uncharacterized protein N7468_005031 [Penicillium chermesinum]KAJ5232075.1 hypothetical protein N7468_005031 [Penicillium chermesinum]